MQSIPIVATLQALIVDDDRAMRWLLASQLRMEGFAVHEAPNALVARHVLDEIHPDLVVLDVHLPGGSGLDLAAELREKSPQLPILLITAFPDRAIHELA